MSIKRGAIFCISLLFLFVMIADAATLTPPTVQAWDRYYKWADTKVSQEVRDLSKFLIQDRLSPKERQEIQHRLQTGQAYVERMTNVVPGNEKFSVPDGEIHHWWGTILLPKIKMAQLMPFLKDYNHHAGKFSDVVGSKLISREGEHFTISYRLRRTKVITVNFNTTQDATYYPVDASHVWSKSAATKIAELEDAGTPKEKELPPGEDQGFLWRLVSWWRFQETEAGVIVELESASLSRDIPFALKLIPFVSSYIRSTPKETLESVLLSIRAQFANP